MKTILTIVLTAIIILVGGSYLPALLMPFIAKKEYFAGGYPSMENEKSYRAIQLYFPAGTRTNWHSHSDGQLLMVETGVARAQVRGESARDISPGEPWWTDPGVEHWHGALPDESVLQLTVYAGDVKWLEPVGDDEYHADHSH